MWLKRLSPSFLLVLFCFTFVNAQPVSRVQELIDTGEYERARILCDSVLKDLSQKNNWAYYASKQGDVYYFLGDLKESLKYYLQALEHPNIDHAENLLLKEETTSYAGFVFRELGLDEQAETYFRAALEQAFVLGDSVEIAICYYNISTVLLNQGMLDESMDLLQKAYEIDVIRKDTAAIGFDLTMMGNAMQKTGNPEKAIDYYRESIELLAKSTGNYNSLAKRYGLLAEAFMGASKWDSATYYTKKSIAAYSEQSDSVHIGEQWVLLARIANEQSNAREALNWGRKARNLFKSYPVSSNQLYANASLVSAYLLQANYAQSTELLKENIQLAEKLGLLYELHEGYEQLAQVYALQDNFRTAYQQAVIASNLADSISTLETNKATERMRVRYDAEKIESENKVLQLENEVTRAELAEREAEIRNLILIGVILLIIAIAVIVIIIMRAQYKTRLLQAEINELRARIRGILEFKPEEVGIVKEQINDSLQDSLSDREFEILNLALSNKNNNEIADEIHVSVNTVKYHLKNIYSKLGVSNRKEALKYAVQITST